MPVEPDRNRNGDQRDGEREMQQPQRLCICRLLTPDDPAQPDVHRGQREREPGHSQLVDLVDHRVRLEKINAGIDESQRRREMQQRTSFRNPRHQRSHRKDGEEHRSEDQCDREFGPAIELRIPADI